MKNLTNWFKELTPTVQLVVVVATLLILWVVFKRAKGFLAGVGAKSELEGEKAALEGQGIALSYPKSKYKIYADDLETAMKGPGTNLSVVFSVFNAMQNDLDVLELDTAFGYRSSFWQWPSPTPVDLRAWLKDDLSTAEMTQLNNILSTKGIDKVY